MRQVDKKLVAGGVGQIFGCRNIVGKSLCENFEMPVQLRWPTGYKANELAVQFISFALHVS